MPRRCRRLSVLILLPMFAGGLLVVPTTAARGAEPAAQAPSKLRAGTAVVDITPERLPISMVGSFTDRKAQAVNDPLYVRCLALDDGQTRLALLTIDSCLVSRQILDEAKRRAAECTGLPASHMLMSATHTHTAPPVIDMAQCLADAPYVQLLTARLTEAVERAVENLQPARIGWGLGTLPGEVFNRRWKMQPGAIPPNPFGGTTDRVRTNPGVENPGLIEPAGPTDADVMLLAATTPEGRPLAVYCVYSLHYVGGIPAGTLSADYFGEFDRAMRRRLLGDDANPAFVAMLANGTSGDINNINFRERAPRREPLEQMRLVADRLAAEAESTYRQLTFHDRLSLRAAEQDLTLGVRKPTEADIQQARETLAATDGAPAHVVRDVYAAETLVLADWPDTVSVKLQALGIGDLAIAAIPCEPFVEVGLELKRRSPRRPTFVVGLANGYHGYLPTPEHHELGGYETWRSRWSYLERPASTKIVETLLGLIGSSQ